MINEDKKEIVKLTTQKLLLTLFKLGTPFFQADHHYHQSANKLVTEIDCAKDEISEKIKYLKQMGYIKTFSEKKEKYIEITRKGFKRINQIKTSDVVIKRPEKWDGKWRLVIFDIPRKYNSNRDCLRKKLLSLGFVKVQESVYVYPFECTSEVDMIVAKVGVDRFVSIFVADAIRNEEFLIKQFIDSGILKKSDLK